jgi:hypothetical protein
MVCTILDLVLEFANNPARTNFFVSSVIVGSSSKPFDFNLATTVVFGVV